MEIREWALRILSSEALKDKLFHPGELTDFNPGSPILIKEPARTYEMRLQKRKKEEKLPPLHELDQKDKRVVCLHRFAGHELQAVEIMAYTLLAFPEAPKSFRKGVAHTLQEEQEHVRLYCKRLEELGGSFGTLPLYRHFWIHTPFLTSPMHYVSTMPLTLEMANLDFAPTYGNAFLKGGDLASSELMETILRDEIAHVRFGLTWLRKMKPEAMSEWDAWIETLKNSRLTPRRAKGNHFQEEAREKAGATPEWIQKLREFSLGPSQSERLPPNPLL